MTHNSKIQVVCHNFKEIHQKMFEILGFWNGGSRTRVHSYQHELCEQYYDQPWYKISPDTREAS